MAPYREDGVVCVECLFTWYWLADLCAREGIPFVLGHARSMKAMHGGKAKHEQLDADKIAVLVRGGMLPQAYGYPAEMRATRELLRRRMSRMRKRAELLTHVQPTNHPYHLPASGKKIADKANREGVAQRFPDPAVQQSIEVDLALDLVQTAKAHEAQTFYRLRSSPGVGTILALVQRYEIHAIHRFPRVQEGVSSCRLVKCANEAAGKRSGPSGTKIGNASRQGAFCEAAVLFWRHNPAGHTYLARVEKTHGQGKAQTVLAPPLARAVYDMGQRQTAVDLDKFFQACWSGAGEPAASRAAEGIRLASKGWSP
jgi:transposase